MFSNLIIFLQKVNLMNLQFCLRTRNARMNQTSTVLHILILILMNNKWSYVLNFFVVCHTTSCMNDDDPKSDAFSETIPPMI
jgi:hypothetical protein